MEVNLVQQILMQKQDFQEEWEQKEIELYTQEILACLGCAWAGTWFCTRAMMTWLSRIPVGG